MTPGTPQDQLLARVLAGPLTPELSNELDAWLREDPTHPELLAQFILLEDMLVSARKESAATSVLELLLEMEKNAEPILVTHLPDPPASGRILALTQQRSVRWFALAASILICMSAGLWGLSVLFTGQTNQHAQLAQDNSNMPAASTESTPRGSNPQQSPIVATLTAEHDAVWTSPQAEGASAPVSIGHTLRAGDRLTLSQGFVEITTARGAVAIVQAPGTIELIDDNAIRLHAGKLVGICETESSKGFTVYTDTAKVTDIGTVFGVERDALGQTITGVLTGHVVLSNKVSNDEPRLLKAGDLAGITADGLATTETPADAIRRFRDWRKLLRPVTVTGDAVFVQNMPAQLHEDHELVRVYREPGGVLLQEDLIVSRTEPGLYRPTDANERSTVPAGTRVDSYLVHINRPRRPTNRITRTFTLTFDQPVIALIVHTNLIITTNGTFGNPTTRYIKAGGIGLVSKSGFATDAPQVDAIDWSDDRKTLRVTLNIEDYDQFRVLTLSPEAASADGLND